MPARDRDRFLSKSMLSIMGVLSRFRLQEGIGGRFEPAPLAKLAALLAIILTVSLASNFFFVLCMLALVLLRICCLPVKALRETLATAVLAALLTLLIMVPALLLGQTHALVVLPIKVFISVALALIVSTTTPFNQLTASLRTLHVPNLLILTLDLTLKYIVMLGEIALEMLMALRCRSVGKNTEKGKSLGGVLGVTFIKSQELSMDTYAAMTCRGFTGEYDAKALRASGRMDARQSRGRDTSAQRAGVQHAGVQKAGNQHAGAQPLSTQLLSAQRSRARRFRTASTALTVLGLIGIVVLFLALEGVLPW